MRFHPFTISDREGSDSLPNTYMYPRVFSLPFSLISVISRAEIRHSIFALFCTLFVAASSRVSVAFPASGKHFSVIFVLFHLLSRALPSLSPLSQRRVVFAPRLPPRWLKKKGKNSQASSSIGVYSIDRAFI